MPGIFVIRVRDGQIVSSRDYLDHLGMARLLGRLDELVAALKTASAPGPDALTEPADV
jgi:hypothetical protein